MRLTQRKDLLLPLFLGQLRFWNPDDLNASPSISPTQDWIEEKLCEVCANLGISRDGHLSRKKLVSICEQYGLQNIDTQVSVKPSISLLRALDFSLDGKINLAELTLALENELLVVKNGIYQAALASFKTEIRHLMLENTRKLIVLVIADGTVVRLPVSSKAWNGAEKEKETERERLDGLETQTPTHSFFICLHSKLDEEYKERVAALKNELQKDREQIQHQASKQRAEMEQEMEKMKMEENYLRDRLALTLKENTRLEKELLETGEKAAKYESMMSKLQKNWENELQDQIDELQSQLEEYQAQGRVVRPSLKNSLYEELDDGGVECGQEPASEDCNPLNMSIEAEMVIEQMKDQHHRDLCNLQEELENTVRCSRFCLETHMWLVPALCDKETETLQQKFSEERQSLESQVEHLQAQVGELQQELVRVQQEAESRQSVEQSDLHVFLEEEADRKAHSALQYETELQARLKEAQESFSHEREELVQARVWLEEKMRGLAEAVQKEKAELENGFQQQLQQLLDQHTQEKEDLRRDLALAKMESEFNRRISLKEEQFAIDRQGLASKYGEAIKGLEERYQREMQELSELQCEEKSQWEFEKDEIVQDGAEAQERWKEMLEKERSVASALAQEKNLLEKNFKEYVNSFLLEKEQLQKELQDMKKQEDELRERLLQTETTHEQEMKKREEEMSIVEGDRNRALQKLGKLETEFAHEKKELNSRLIVSEHLKQEALRTAAAEQEKLRLEISGLESRIEELQQELQHLSKLQGDKDGGTLGGDFPGPDKSQEPREVVDLLSNQEEFKALPGEGDMEALPLMGKLPKEPERELTQSPGFTPLVPDSLVDSQLIHTTNEEDSQVKSEGGIKKLDGSACSLLETEGTMLEESMEASLVLEKTYEEMRAENQALRAQQALLQERISLLEAECDQAAHDRQDMASQVQKELDEILKTIPQPNALSCGRDDGEILFPWETAEVAILPTDCTVGSKGLFAETLEPELNTEEISAGSLQLEMDHREAGRREKGELKYLVPELWDTNVEKKAGSRLQPKALALSEELKLENRVLKAEMIKLLERNNKLEGYLPKLISLQCRLDEADQESFTLKEEKVQLLEEVRKLEEVRDQLVLDNAELQSANLVLQSRLGKLEEFVANLKALKGGRHSRCESSTKEVEAEKKGLHELNRKLREKIAALLKQKGTHAQERVDLNAALHDLQSTCAQQRQKLELLRHKIGTVQKEKVAVQKMAENFKKQASELRARNHQLQLENAELGRRNPSHQADIQDLNQQLRKVFRHREKGASKCGPEEWGRENSQLKEELENCKIQLRVQAQALEQENNFLKEELEKVKQVRPDFSDLQNEISSVIVKNEKLLKEKEALNEELNRCVEKIQSFEDAMQNVNHQMSWLRSDLRLSQQEKEALEQDVISLHKQLQTANDKNRVLEVAMHSAGLQNQQKKLCWDELDQLVKQEQQLLRQENERLQREVQSAKADLSHSREKVNRHLLQILLIFTESGSPFLQSGHEQLLKTMEKRMMDVEQQLRLVKRLLQDKVNQLKEQLTKNRKANEMVKDLYVENAQLLKALEMTEQRHKTVEKKNYLLEEKIANLSRIVNNLASPTLGSTVQLGS
ncbi:hypothetical protein JD844_020281 [Phrynosoma platyrhinos]|uniref:Ninein n=1 Tax=Phrynosoma platyrhinos TaxID=52577 RepID=A0ABQ7SSB1_PHRPL|nr:hypothetical protein JD844_020281 [Phrynosoma platyrhinos]